MAKPILGYLDLRLIAEPIRYLLHYKKVDFEDKRYPTNGLGHKQWLKEESSLGLDFPSLPYYLEGDIKLTQTIAIMRYLGYKFGMTGNSNDEKRRVVIVEQQSVDFRDTSYYPSF
ncbi:Glutathione S-transferase [Araneus ventricosus]|uniref:glutathione transferase n=1 Tax=Araneus ventricosus TaxID=182803 RepID=A0A4Y2DF91_ARAVE|nr:Glutathione S-transferase [Araneus ventricosus]